MQMHEISWTIATESKLALCNHTFWNKTL